MESGRAVGDTEKGWCRAVGSGTGVSIAAVHFTNRIPHETLTSALHHLQLRHPILRSKISKPTPTTFHLSTTPTPTSTLQARDELATSEILSNIPNRSDSPLHALAEHEMNLNPWTHSDLGETPIDVMFGSVYDLGSDGVVFVIRVHIAVADRTSLRSVLKEALEIVAGKNNYNDNKKLIVLPALEDLVPEELAKKSVWARGKDIIGYTLNHVRSSIIGFDDTKAERESRLVAFELDVDQTDQLLENLKHREIKLYGALVAAVMIAVMKSKQLRNCKCEPNQVITLSDCRKRLTRDLQEDDIGFYHAVIQNMYSVTGEEEFWELARKCHTTFTNAQNCDKDLTDLADLTFLLVKAIDNPAITPSFSLRTALLSVFDEPLIFSSSDYCAGVDVKDFVTTVSVHGLAPCLALFDSIKDGRLVCLCTYPSPLYSRNRIQAILDDVKSLLVTGVA